MDIHSLPVAIIGAGPVGLAAAAHLIGRGETPIVFEAGAEVGANIRTWGHVHLFSPWRWCLDTASVALLERQVEEGFLRRPWQELLSVASSAEGLLDALAAARPRSGI